MSLKKSSTFTNSSPDLHSSEELLKLYSKEYHKGHLDWAREETPIFRHYRDNYMRLIDPQKNMKILELGCSAGKTSVELARRGCQVIAVDFDQNAVDLARQFAKECGVENNIEFVCASADNNELMSKQFETVTMLDFVEHVPDSIVRNILSNLKSSGFKGNICIYTPDRHHFTEILAKWGVIQGDSTHINLKSRKEWISLLTACEMKIQKLTRETTHWPILRSIEGAFNKWPLVGGLLTRSIAIKGTL